MTSPACCVRGEIPGPLGPLPARGEDGTAPVFGATIDNFDLLRRATQMMATGALTEDQARTLSRQILTSVAWSPGY
jgi:hypothetical protein